MRSTKEVESPFTWPPLKRYSPGRPRATIHWQLFRTHSDTRTGKRVFWPRGHVVRKTRTSRARNLFDFFEYVLTLKILSTAFGAPGVLYRRADSYTLNENIFISHWAAFDNRVGFVGARLRRHFGGAERALENRFFSENSGLTGQRCCEKISKQIVLIDKKNNL